MTSSMIFTMPVIMDNTAKGNLPLQVKDEIRQEMLERYCRFREAHRILMTFCTYTALSGNFGEKSRVQYPIHSDDFTDPENYWYKKFSANCNDGAIIEVEIDAVVDIKVEIIRK